VVVEIQITVDAVGDDAAAHELYYWLRRDRELRRHVEIELARPSDGSGRMSAGEIINMFISDGIAAAGLLVNIVGSWQAARPSTPGAVTFERDGMTVTVHDGSEEALRRVVELLAPETHGGGAGANDAQPPSAPTGSGNR
jgi:hypothetical protein